MSLRSFNPCFGLARRTVAIAVSCFLVAFAFAFMVMCFSQLSAGHRLPDGVRAAFAVASMLQVVLVALASTIISASWKEDARLIRFSAYSTVIHLTLNLVALACLLTTIASTVSCTTGEVPCSELVAAKPAWDVISALILVAQLYLSLVAFSYFINLHDHSRRPYMPEISSRSLFAPAPHKPGHKHLLSSSESYPNVELGTIESGTAPSSPAPDPEAGYGGGMRTHEEAQQNEKERMRREMEGEGDQEVSFPIPLRSETGILTPLGLQWRDGDLPPYAS